MACYMMAKIAGVDVVLVKASVASVALVCAADTAGRTRATAVVASMESMGSNATFVLQPTSKVIHENASLPPGPLSWRSRQADPSSHILHSLLYSLLYYLPYLIFSHTVQFRHARLRLEMATVVIVPSAGRRSLRRQQRRQPRARPS